VAEEPIEASAPLEPHFLSVEQVLDLHAEAIARYGGDPGLRDRRLLESAVLAPQQTFDGALLYTSLAQIGAAYWIGLVTNHAFVDGNKRVGLFACDVFLLMNGYKLTLTPQATTAATLLIATGQIERAELVALIERSIEPL
jgi:death-on-curing protein